MAAISGPSARLAPAAASPLPSWGKAQPVPGTSATNGATVAGVSCAPGGTCTAIGDEDFSSATSRTTFVVTARNGVWGPAQPLPGLAAFAPQGATPQALSCPASGDCLVTGTYSFGTSIPTDGSGVFVEQENNGVWDTPTAVPGSVLSVTQGYAEPSYASCASPGNCLLEGIQAGTQSFAQSIFIAQETNYQWSALTEVPGLAALNVEDFAEANGVSCPAPGDCVAVGSYVPPDNGGAGAFAAVETNGTWQNATQLPTGSPASTGAITGLSLSCPAAGKCVVAGSYEPALSATPQTGFAVTQTPSGWSAPVIFNGSEISALSCPLPGTCEAAAQGSAAVAEVISEVHGTWGKVRTLPGATALTYNGTKAAVSQISNLACPSAGNCTAAGTYYWNMSASPPSQNVFVASEVAGKWLPARVPAGLLALNTAGYANVAGLDCAAAANCLVGGDYNSTAATNQGAFLLSEIPRR